MKKIIGMTMLLLGMVILLCFGENPEKPDGFGYVVALLLAGLALFGIGAWLAGLLDTEDKQKQTVEIEGFSKQDDHNPYPEE